MQALNEHKETGCCPHFDPKLWQEKEIHWHEKLFVKDHVRNFMHIPLNFGSVMKRNMAKMEAVQATPKPEDYIVLSDEKSPWRSDVYIGVNKNVLGSEMAHLSGTFLTKVFDGPYSQMCKWIKEEEGFVNSKGKKIEKMYFYYTTCPKCAKAYGHNYTVLMSKVA